MRYIYVELFYSKPRKSSELSGGLLDSKLHFASQNDLQNASQNALSILQQQQFSRITSAVCYSSSITST